MSVHAGNGRPVLDAQGVSVSFGGVRALVDVDLQVHEAQLVGLIGPNGAGKTTCIDALTGFVPCGGRAQLDGRELMRLPAHARARLGLARTWQSIELFDDLSIRENLMVASHRPTLWESAKEALTGPRTDAEAVDEALEHLGLGRFGDQMPSELPQGQRKLVGVARALVAKPRVICMDEPAAGLDTTESGELGRHLRQVVESGTSILLVDHDMGLVLGICDYVFVLEFGKLIAQGTPDAVRGDARVISAYLGSAAESAHAVLEGTVEGPS